MCDKYSKNRVWNPPFYFCKLERVFTLFVLFVGFISFCCQNKSFVCVEKFVFKRSTNLVWNPPLLVLPVGAGPLLFGIFYPRSICTNIFFLSNIAISKWEIFVFVKKIHYLFNNFLFFNNQYLVLRVGTSSSSLVFATLVQFFSIYFSSQIL